MAIVENHEELRRTLAGMAGCPQDFECVVFRCRGSKAVEVLNAIGLPPMTANAVGVVMIAVEGDCHAIHEALERGDGATEGHMEKPVIESLPSPIKRVGAKDHHLSRREEEVLERLAAGLTSKEIASFLGISAETVRVHLKNIYSKIEVHTRVAAAMWYRDVLGCDVPGSAVA